MYGVVEMIDQQEVVLRMLLFELVIACVVIADRTMQLLIDTAYAVCLTFYYFHCCCRQNYAAVN